MDFRTLAYAAAVCLAAPVTADTLSVETARGIVDVPLAPETIAVFDVAAADTLDALGVEITGTLNGLYVDYLEEIEAKAADLGTFWEPDVEAIHALSPDLIVVGSRSSDQVDPLSRIAPAIDMTVGDDTLNEALVRLSAYGEIFGRQEKAQTLAMDFDTQLSKAKAAATGQGTALIVMTNGPKISAYGAAGRFGWLHTALGLEQAAPELGTATHGESISFEFIREKDPDWLVVVDRLVAIGQPGDAAAVTLDNVLVRDTKAWTTGQVVYLNSADIYVAGGGYQSMMRTLKVLTAAFEGE